MKAVILAGGTGTRLWPLSHDLKPKQFHAFVGNQTMLQQTYERLSFLNPKDIFVATNVQYVQLVKKQLKKLPAKNLIIEPAMRDTGPCICFAANYLARLGFADEVMSIIYADHLIQKPQEFQAALAAAADHVQKTNCLGVIAIRAKYPNPNLGWIRIGKSHGNLGGGLEMYELEKFVEKPTEKTAKKFLLSRRYLWNTGLYMWRVNTILEKFKKHAPSIFKTARDEASYTQAPKISIDYAIVEKIPPAEVHVMPADFGWNDVGNWAALHEELAKNDDENVTSGNSLNLETKGSVILNNSGRLIVTYGVKNMVIIDTPEALLVMPKEKSAEAKKLTEEIKKHQSRVEI